MDRFVGVDCGVLMHACEYRERLEGLRTWSGAPLPPKLMDALRRLMRQHHLLSEQLLELEAARDAVVAAPDADREVRMIWLLTQIVGLGIETATTLVRETFCRRFRDRRALALATVEWRAGETDEGSEREQGIGKSGNPRVRRILMQLTWRWLRFQPESALSRWFAERTGGAKGRIRKIMVVALARKLLVALWRYAHEGVVPEGAHIIPA